MVIVVSGCLFDLGCLVLPDLTFGKGNSFNCGSAVIRGIALRLRHRRARLPQRRRVRRTRGLQRGCVMVAPKRWRVSSRHPTAERRCRARTSSPECSTLRSAGSSCSGPQADARRADAPSPGRRSGPATTTVRRFRHHFVGEPRRNGLFGRQPAAPVAVVLGHQGFELLGRASRTGGVDRGDAGVGLVQQMEVSGDLRERFLVGRTDRRVNQIEGVRRDFAAPFPRPSLRDRSSRPRPCSRSSGW